MLYEVKEGIGSQLVHGAFITRGLRRSSTRISVNIDLRHIKDRPDQTNRSHSIWAQLNLLQPTQSHRPFKPLRRHDRVDPNEFSVQGLLKLGMRLTRGFGQKCVNHGERHRGFLITKNLRE